MDNIITRIVLSELKERQICGIWAYEEMLDKFVGRTWDEFFASTDYEIHDGDLITDYEYLGGDGDKFRFRKLGTKEIRLFKTSDISTIISN